MTLTAPMLGLVQETGDSVLTLTDGLAQGELLGSRLTRAEVSRHLGALASAMKTMPDEVVRAMPEIDWGGWRAVEAALRMDGPAQEDALWFGVGTLVPATLAWLRVYRQRLPALFTYWS